MNLSVASDQLSLNQSQIDADHLRGFFKNPHNTVGRYFESLVYYWIKYVRGLEVLVVTANQAFGANRYKLISSFVTNRIDSLLGDGC